MGFKFCLKEDFDKNDIFFILGHSNGSYITLESTIVLKDIGHHVATDRTFNGNLANGTLFFPALSHVIAFLFIRNDNCHDIEDRIIKLFELCETTVPLTYERTRLNDLFQNLINHWKLTNDPESFWSLHITTNWEIKSNLPRSEKSSYDDDSLALDLTLFNYVACLDQFGVAIPITLIEKLVPEEWERSRLAIMDRTNSDLGLGSYFDEELKVPHLQLNEIGKENSSSIEFHDKLVVQILTYCDCSIEAENALFNSLCLKRHFFTAIFQTFNYDLNLLLFSDKFPSPEKESVLLRLLGVYYGENDEYVKMRSTFQKCITLLNDSPIKKSSSFYMDWASYEIKFEHYEQAIQVYNQVLEDLPFPDYKNRSARFHLSLYYYKENELNKTIQLWSPSDFVLIRDDGFITKFNSLISYLIATDRSHDAGSLQSFIIRLSQYLNLSGRSELATDLMGRISSAINNNYKLKTSFIRLTAKHDPSKALEMLKELEQDETIPRVDIALANMDYHLTNKEPEMAIWYGQQFLNTEHDGKSRVIRKFVSIYLKKNNNKALFYCEQLSDEELKAYYQYAVLLHELDSNKYRDIIYSTFRNYFEQQPLSSNSLAVTKYVSFCIRHKMWKEASEIVLSKILQINSNESYSKYFISTLFQLQMKLTSDEEHIVMLRDRALEYSDKDKQTAIIHSNYGKHLMRSEANRKVNHASRYDLTEAINHFTNSLELYSDDRVKLDRARCHYYLNAYNECLVDLNEINSDKFEYQKALYQLKSLFALSSFERIKDILTEIKHPKLKGTAHYYLASNTDLSREQRKSHFSLAIELNGDFRIKLDQAAYYYSFNRHESLKLLERLKSSFKGDEERQGQIQKLFLRKAKPSSVRDNLIKTLNLELDALKFKRWTFINGVNNLLEKHPFDTRVYNIAFDYHYKFGEYLDCEKILETIIENNLINPISSPLFYKIAKNYFDYSQYFSWNKKIDKANQVRCLNTAFRYSEYSLKEGLVVESAVLYALIPYKQGQFGKHKTIVNWLTKNLDAVNLETFKSKSQEEKSKVKTFLWSIRDEDYYDKLMFYKGQEKSAAAIIGDTNQSDKSNAVKILKSIQADRFFHKENNYVMLNRIQTRLGHYYYHIEENYQLAYHHNKKIYKSKSLDLPFIRAFLLSLEKVNRKAKTRDYKFAKEVCEYYLESVKDVSIYRHYGNFLKELGEFSAAYESYKLGLEIADSTHLECLMNNNLILLFHMALRQNNFFMDCNRLCELAKESFNNIISLDREYKHKEESLKKVNEILAICEGQ